jgi:Flp pilus assembly protein CpaB
MELTGRRRARTDWRQLLGTRRGTVVAGLGCAVLAGAILLFAMARYRSTVDATGNRSTVLVATQRIPKNTSGDVLASERLVKATQIAAKQVTAGAVADIGVIRGRVAAHDILPGEQVTSADFTGNAGLTGELSPSHRAMTVALDSEHGMVGLLHDGDRVDVYGGINAQAIGGRDQPVLRLLMRNVPVLKAATTTGAGSSIGGAGASNNTSDVTLDVSDSAAGDLAYAADSGKVWLVLRPANAVDTAPPSLTTVQSFLLATQPVASGGAK